MRWPRIRRRPPVVPVDRRAVAARHVDQLLAVEAGMPEGLRDVDRIAQLLAYRAYLQATSARPGGR